MVEKNIVISNKEGIHSSVVSRFISYVYKFKCDIEIVKGTKHANAKSLLSLLMLDVNYGDEITVKVSGLDEQNVLEKVLNYIAESMG